MKRVLFAAGFAVALFAASHSTPADAGECENGYEFYLWCLESDPYDPEQCGTQYDCLRCLGTPKPTKKQWATDTQAERLEFFAKNPLRDRVVDAATPFLDDPDGRLIAARLMAFRDVKKVGDHDIFEIIADWNSPSRWFALAAMKDARTVGLASTEYRRLRDVDSDRARRELGEIAECLYHIPGNGAIALLDSLGLEETDPARKKRIQQITFKRLRFEEKKSKK